MRKWRKAAHSNLLAWSNEKVNHLKAAQEWEFTGKVIDNGNTANRCELCEGENLRYHFEVKHETGNRYINVGSSCITKFGLQVRDDVGNLITDTKEKNKYLKKKLTEKQKEIYLEKLREGYRRVSGNEKSWIEYIGTKIKDDEKFDIREAVEIQEFLEDHEICFDTNFITFDTRSSIVLLHLANIDTEHLNEIFKCLSPAKVKTIKKRLLSQYGLVC